MPGYGMGSPGAYLSNESRYARMLQSMPDSNNGTSTGGLASILQKALMGYMMGKEGQQQEGAQQTMAQALQTMQGSPASSIQFNSPRPDGTGEMTQPVPAVPGDRGLAMRLLASNPNTAGIGYQMAMGDADYTRKRADKAADTQTQFDNSKALLLAPKREEAPTSVREYQFAQENGFKGSFEDFKKISTQSGQEAFSMSPIWGTDEKGNPVLLQASNRGGVKPAAMPPGVTPQRGQTQKVDNGTYWTILDANGNAIGVLPKDVAGAAAAKAGGAVEGAAVGHAKVDLPTLEANAKYTTELLDGLYSPGDPNTPGSEKVHPGLSGVVGMPSVSGALRIPGTDEADFRARLEQIQGKQFLEAFNTLKGGGQITEVEGAKAQNAIARMQTAQTEKQFKEAVTEFRGIVQQGLDRARQRAGAPSAAPQDTGLPPLPPGFSPVTRR